MLVGVGELTTWTGGNGVAIGVFGDAVRNDGVGLGCETAVASSVSVVAKAAAVAAAPIRFSAAPMGTKPLPWGNTVVGVVVGVVVWSGVLVAVGSGV